MAAHPAEEQQSLSQWLPHFFRQELAPYPGRWSQVARMVIAATLSLIVIVTFKIPYGAIGVNCAFILSRENLLSTVRSGFYFIVAFAAWALFTPIGARMFASIPLTHFLWEGFTIFLCFFCLRVLTNFVLAAGIVVVATATLTIWYLPGPAELNVELTLWQILATAIGAVITLLVEVVFRCFAPTDALVSGMAARFRVIEEMLDHYARGTQFSSSVVQTITQYAVVGAGTLRQQIARGRYSAVERARLNALVSLLGRALDICAALSATDQERTLTTKHCAENLRMRISVLRHEIETKHLLPVDSKMRPVADSPLLFLELESTVGSMESIFDANTLIDPKLAISEEKGRRGLFLVSDAFTNNDHIKFALAGTTAAMLCYVIYTALDWPGISTAVTTCLLTALSNIGSARQKQMLRIGGAAIGGFVFGLGSQIFILPYIDSILGLSALLAIVTGISAYVATSSPRLSYAGLQMAFAFYLINVTDFSISLDLTIGRDRAVGVVLGIAAMWLVFDRIHGRPAGIEMVRGFAQSARLIASLRPKPCSDAEIIHIRAIRDQISSLFNSVNAEADAVIFEGGKDRASQLAAHECIRRWLSTLRTIYVLELPLLQCGLTGEREQLSQTFFDAEERLFEEIAQSLNRIANYLESQIGAVSPQTLGPKKAEAAIVPVVVDESISRLREERLLLSLSAQLSRLTMELEADVFKNPIVMSSPH